MDVLNRLLPLGYRPFRELEVCSNLLTDVLVPLAVNGHPLLLVGTGAMPLVWLAGPSDPTARSWRFVVERSRSTNPAILVDLDRRTKVVFVEVSGDEVLRVQWLSPERATVQVLDFTPLGLALQGDEEALTLGTSRLSGSSVSGAKVAFEIEVARREADGHPHGERAITAG